MIKFIKDNRWYRWFVLILLILRFVIFPEILIASGSMEPTLNTKAHCLTINTRLTEVHRGDIVTFKPPHRNAIFVKRVIGLPGETVKFENGKVFIDGKELYEPYVVKDDYNGLIEVPEDEYLLLGDNRPNSEDGRYFGTVKKNKLYSKAIFVTYRKGSKLNGIIKEINYE